MLGTRELMVSKNLGIHSLLREEIHINQIITEINTIQLVSAMGAGAWYTGNFYSRRGWGYVSRFAEEEKIRAEM